VYGFLSISGHPLHPFRERSIQPTGRVSVLLAKIGI
jgi:hypothetical protein